VSQTHQSHKDKQKQKGAMTLDKIHQQSFDNVKATITEDITLAYPEHTQGFEVFTDSSKLQLGAVITQNNRLLAFLSKKRSPEQQKYSAAKQ
jgi:hypothetical protein